MFALAPSSSSASPARRAARRFQGLILHHFLFVLHHLGWGTALKALSVTTGIMEEVASLQTLPFSFGAISLLPQSDSTQKAQNKGNFFCFFPLQMQFWQTYVGKSCFLHVLMLNIPLSVQKELTLL